MISESRPISRNPAIWVTVVLTSVAIMPVSAPQCNVFFICPLNHFCYKPTGICIQCLNCSSHNRLSSVSRNCHESAQDCGECFPGFKEEYLAQKIGMGVCVAGEPTSAATTTTTATVETNTTSVPGRTVVTASMIPLEMIRATAAISVVSIIIFSLIGARFFRSKRRKSISEQAVAQDVQSPKLCTEPSSFPLLPMHHAVVMVSEERTVEFHLPMQTNYQTPLSAVPWKDPLYARSSSSESIEGYDELLTEPPFPEIDDEDTNPSVWEPTPDQRPRNIQETDDITERAEVPEADSAHPPVPSSDVEQTLQPSQSTEGDNPPLTEPPPVPATDNHLEVSSTVSASSSSLQLDGNIPFGHLGSNSDQEEPIRKRTRREDDTQSIGDAPQASVPPFLDQNSYSSLFDDLLVSSQPNRVPSTPSEQNLRQV